MADFANGVAMVAGDGTQSYTKNSLYQRAVMEAGKLLIQKSIADHLEPWTNSSSSSFCIADLGCSVGQNTCMAMDNIIESVKLKYLNSKSMPEFQVHFNDHTLNDFNTLFRCSLPPKRGYYASGVPGSFYGRLFPRSSLHIAHSSYSLQWLSQVPKEIMDPGSPAYNKGRIHYIGENEEVFEAYSRQHSKDLSNFLRARAQEIVPRGLLIIILPARPDHVHHSQDAFVIIADRLGASLMDLAKQGVIAEEMVDSFNVPTYMASPREIEEVVKRDGNFDIEKMEALPKVTASYRPSSPKDVSNGIRAIMGGLIEEHFGHGILDDVFRIFEEKLAQASQENPGWELNLFVLLKRKE